MYQLILPAYKADLDSELYKKLCDGLEKLGLSGVLVDSDSSVDSITRWVLVFCIVLNVFLIAGIVFIIIYTVKKVKRLQNRYVNTEDQTSYDISEEDITGEE